MYLLCKTSTQRSIITLRYINRLHVQSKTNQSLQQFTQTYVDNKWPEGQEED